MSLGDSARLLDQEIWMQTNSDVTYLPISTIRYDLEKRAWARVADGWNLTASRRWRSPWTGLRVLVTETSRYQRMTQAGQENGLDIGAKSWIINLSYLLVVDNKRQFRQIFNVLTIFYLNYTLDAFCGFFKDGFLVRIPPGNTSEVPLRIPTGILSGIQEFELGNFSKNYRRISKWNSWRNFTGKSKNFWQIQDSQKDLLNDKHKELLKSSRKSKDDNKKNPAKAF